MPVFTSNPLHVWLHFKGCLDVLCVSPKKGRRVGEKSLNNDHLQADRSAYSSILYIFFKRKGRGTIFLWSFRCWGGAGQRKDKDAALLKDICQASSKRHHLLPGLAGSDPPPTAGSRARISYSRLPRSKPTGTQRDLLPSKQSEGVSCIDSSFLERRRCCWMVAKTKEPVIFTRRASIYSTTEKSGVVSVVPSRFGGERFHFHHPWALALLSGA